MTVDMIIWTMLVYISVYYFLARSVARKINQLNPAYFCFGRIDGELPVGMETSLAIGRMIFDRELTGRQYGKEIRLSLYAVRILLASALPFVVVLSLL